MLLPFFRAELEVRRMVIHTRLIFAWGLTLVVFSSVAHAGEKQMTVDLQAVSKLSAQERRTLIEATPREELEQALRQISASALLDIGRRAVSELGTYRVRLTKSERIGSKMVGPQTMKLEIREAPLALRAEVVAGPAKGRRLLYNEKLRAKELRVREAWILGIAGAVWISIEGSLAKKDTRHAITDLGFGPLLQLLAKDLEQGKASGGHTRKDEGFDAKGAWCILFTAPAAAKNLYAPEARVCFEPKSGLMSRVEVFDRDGLLERFDYELLEARLQRGEDHFTLDAAGL